MHLTACKLMSSPVLSFTQQPTVSQVFETIISNDFNGFPIVNEDKRLIGLISRHFLTILLTKQCWKDRSSITPRTLPKSRTSLGAQSTSSLVGSDDKTN